MDHLCQKICIEIPDFCFPNWPITIFYMDYIKYPIPFEKYIVFFNQNDYHNISYIDFFNISRGYIRPNYNKQKILWDIFNKGSMFLYFENILIKCIDDNYIKHKHEDVLYSYLEKLSSSNITNYDKIVSELGACCFEFFNKEHELYLDRIDNNEKTDQELLNLIDYKTILLPQLSSVTITRNHSRSECMEYVIKKIKK